MRKKQEIDVGKRGDNNSKYLPLPIVYVPSPYVFYPNFDDANLNHRKNCNVKHRNASKNREITCEKLEATKYQNDPKLNQYIQN